MDYRKKKIETKDIQTKRRHTERETGPPVITVDYERYEHLLEDADLTGEQKREFLQALWNIIVEFVSLGFGVHPLQQAQNPCGKLKENSAQPAITALNGVYLDQEYLAENFVRAVNLETDKTTQGVDS